MIFQLPRDFTDVRFPVINWKGIQKLEQVIFDLRGSQEKETNITNKSVFTLTNQVDIWQERPVLIA